MPATTGGGVQVARTVVARFGRDPGVLDRWHGVQRRWSRSLHDSRGYEVNRPDRSVRNRKGESDLIDAEMAARGVLAGVTDATPI